MSEPVSKLSSNNRFRWWCPGCECSHIVLIAANGWTFNNDFEHPTLTPSVLVHSHKTFINAELDGDALVASDNITDTPRCHSFIRDGRIEFLGDCTHLLGGQTVDMEPLR